MAGKWLLRPSDQTTYAYSFATIADANPAANWSSWQSNYGTTWKTVSGVMLSNEQFNSAATTYPQRESTTQAPISRNQFSRVWLNTCDTGGSFSSGYGPCVLLSNSSAPRPYYVTVNTTRSVISFPNGGETWIGEGGADGDVWELQAWGDGSLIYLRVLRNWRVVGSVAGSNITATGAFVVPDSNTLHPVGGFPGIYAIVALPGGFATWGGGITRWEGGELPGDMVPWFVPTAAAAETAILMGQAIY